MWRCDCGHSDDDTDRFLTHVWVAHARDAVMSNPVLIEALWKNRALSQLARCNT